MKALLWTPLVLMWMMGHMIHWLLKRRIKISRPGAPRLESTADHYVSVKVDMLQLRNLLLLSPALDLFVVLYPCPLLCCFHSCRQASALWAMLLSKQPTSKSSLLIPLPISVLKLLDLVHPGSKDSYPLPICLYLCLIPLYFYHPFYTRDWHWAYR